MKKILRYFLMLLLLNLMFCLGGCGTTLTTRMEMSENFAGSRIMDLEVDLTTLDEERLKMNAPNGDYEPVIEKIKGAMPEELTVTYEKVKEDKYIFHFVLTFTSQEDYKEKVGKLLGYDFMSEFSNATTPFAEKVDFKENFTSAELLNWLPKYLERMNYITSEEGKRFFDKISNSVTINGVKNDISKKYISLEKRAYVPIENINIFTDVDAKEAKVARKIEIIFRKDILDAYREKVEKYLSKVTPTECMSEWQEMDGGREKFVLLISPCTPDEMEAVMNTFCASKECDVQLIIAGEIIGNENEESNDDSADEEEQATKETSYSELWDKNVVGNLQQSNVKDYSQPFSYEATIKESLDLRAFVCNSWGEINTTYYISAKNGKPKSMLYHTNGDEVYGWDYLSEEYPEYYFVENEWNPIYQVVSKVDKAYVPTSAEINTKVKSEKKVTREFVFKFDEPFEEAVLTHINVRMKHLFSEHKKLLTYEVKNNKKSANITLKFSGSVKAVDALCEEIFGQGYSDIGYSCQDDSGVTSKYNFNESIDLGNIFNWNYSGNIDYDLKLPGKIDKSYSNISGGVNSKPDISGKKLNYISTESGYLNVNILGAKTNGVTVFFIVLITVSVLIGIAVVIFVVLRLVKTEDGNPILKTKLVCGHCGSKIPRGGVFCPKCGKRVANIEEET